MASAAASCECHAKQQTAEHVLTSCPVYHHPNEACGRSDVNKSTKPNLVEPG